MLACLLLAALLPAPSHQVWVVATSPAPGVDFTSLQAAVDAASDGDTILIRAGTYANAAANVTIDGKSLVLSNDSTSPILVSTSTPGVLALSVRNLPLGGSVVVRGINMGYGMRTAVEACAGSVWFDTCGLDSMRVVDSSAVLLTNCVVVGNSLGTEASVPTPGLLATNSNVHAFDTHIEGGSGVAFGFFGSYSENGVELDASFAYFSGCELSGGEAGGHFAAGCFSFGSGSGLTVAGGSLVEALDTLMSGGTSICTPFPSAPPFIITSGTLDTLPGSARSMSIASPKREGEMLAIEIRGVPGDLAFYALSPAQAPLYVPSFLGTIGVALPASVFFAGAIDASGELTKTVPVPEQGHGIEGIASFFQPGFLTSALDIRVGAPSALVVLDSSF